LLPRATPSGCREQTTPRCEASGAQLGLIVVVGIDSFIGSSPEAGPHDFAELRPRGVRSAA
jgi:hypothetical protein